MEVIATGAMVGSLGFPLDAGVGLIGLMGLIRRIPIPQSRLGHSFADSAFLDKVLLKPTDLPVQQVVGLVNQTNGDIGDDLGWAGLAEFAIGLVGHTGSLAEFANEPGFFRVLIPEV